MLASPFMLSILEKSEYLFMDGTFQTAPNRYYQTLILMGLSLDTNLYTPITYAFVTSKTQEIYETFFYLLNMHAAKNNFKVKAEHIVIDFETAIHNAVHKVFPNMEIVPCFFHLVNY